MDKARNIRVVVNATYWTGNIMGHSISRSAIDTAKALSALPNVHVILPVPTDKETWKYKQEDLEGIDQVIEMEYANKLMSHVPTEDWWKHFNVKSGDVFYDVVLEFNGPIALQMTNWAMAGNYTSKFIMPAPMTICSIVRPAFLVYELRSKPPHHLLETMSQALLPVMFLTEHQKNLLYTAARQYIAPAKLKGIEERSIVIPHSIATDKIRYVQRKKPEKVRLMFCTTLSAVKQGDKIGKMYDKLLRLGKPVEMVVSLPFRKADVNGSAEAALRNKAYETFGKSSTVYVNPPRAQYERLLEEADVFLCMSKNESFGLSYFEQLQAGQVGIYLNKPWLKGLLPDDYPFLCDTEEEMLARLLWVVDNLEEAQKRVAYMKDWIPERLSKQAVATRMEQFFQQEFSKTLEIDRERMQDQWMYKALEKVLKRDSYTMQDIAKILKDETHTNIFAPSSQYAHTVRRMMQLLGFEDTLNKTGLPVFKRKG